MAEHPAFAPAQVTLLPCKAGLCPSGFVARVHHKGTKACRKAFTTDARRSQAIVFVNHKPITIRITATTGGDNDRRRVTSSDFETSRRFVERLEDGLRSIARIDLISMPTQ